MEEFRGLLNLELPETKLISFVFFGLPEIEENLKLDPPLLQRVAMKCRLQSFSSESTDRYISHRLSLAGSKKTLFTDAAVRAIHRFSHGIPRVINTLCDNALLEGSILQKLEIDEVIVNEVAANLSLEVEAAAIATSNTEAYQPQPTADPDPPLAATDESEVFDLHIDLADEQVEENTDDRFERSESEVLHSDIDALLDGIAEKS